MKWVCLLTLSFILSAGCTPRTRELAGVEKWLILLDYDEEKPGIDPRRLEEFDMIILDAEAHPPLDFVRPETIVLAYVSLGEAEAYRAYWPDIEGRPWIVGPNPNWESNFIVDIRSESWRDLLLEKVLPEITGQDFDGIFMDTLDTADFLASLWPESQKELKAAMTGLVKAIHTRYPDLLLVSNNGFSVLESIAPYLDGIVAEDIHWMVDFEAGGYRPIPESDREAKVQVLRKLMKKHGLPVFTIDYVPQQNQEAAINAASQARSLGFKPYIAEKDLSDIYAQPAV